MKSKIKSILIYGIPIVLAIVFLALFIKEDKHKNKVVDSVSSQLSDSINKEVEKDVSQIKQTKDDTLDEIYDTVNDVKGFKDIIEISTYDKDFTVCTIITYKEESDSVCQEIADTVWKEHPGIAIKWFVNSGDEVKEYFPNIKEK